MITFLSSPKPFKGIAKEQQYRAIRSWLVAANDVEVILYGDSTGIDDAGVDLGVRVVKNVACSPSGIPYFGSIVEYAKDHGKYDLQVYLNCDILLSGIFMAMNQINFSEYLLIGQRIDLSQDVVINFDHSDWMKQLANLVVYDKVKLHSATGIDYFGFRRGMWRDLPPIIIGRGGYDNALLAYCMRNCIPIIDGTFAVITLHQYHDYKHTKGGVKVVMEGSDAMHNFNQGGVKRSAPLVSDAGYVLKNSNVISWPCRGDGLRRIELKLRHEMGWLKTALVLRFIWRVMKAAGIINEPQFNLKEIVDEYMVAYHKGCELT